MINTLGRKNAGMMATTLEYDPSSDRPRTVTTPQGSLPFFPSVGIHIDFSRPRTPRPPSATRD